jgi:hypothetical protein
MRLCEEHRLGGIHGVSAEGCVGCAYDALRESLEAMDESRSSMVSARDLTIRDLRATLQQVAHASGAVELVKAAQNARRVLGCDMVTAKRWPRA